MAVSTAGVTSEGTSQGCHGSRLKSWSQALSAWQFTMGFRGILWAPFTLTLTVEFHAPWLQMVQHACCICNICMHNADLRNHQRVARALAFAVAAECEWRFELHYRSRPWPFHQSLACWGRQARRRLADLNPRFFGHVVPSHR
eukprot:365569-Chlamydomonas_euryale.AAC.20